MISFILFSVVLVAIGAFTQTGKQLINRVIGADRKAASALQDVSNDMLILVDKYKAKLKELKVAIAKVTVERRALADKIEVASLNINKYERIAIRAGEAGEAADVKAALTEKAQAQREFTSFSASYQAIQNSEQKLKDQSDSIEAQIHDIESKRATLSARDLANSAQLAISSVDMGSLNQQLADIEAKVLVDEALLEDVDAAQSLDKYELEDTDAEVSKYLKGRAVESVRLIDDGTAK